MMEFRRRTLGSRLKALALGIDAAIGASTYDLLRRGGEAYERFRSRMDRLSVSGGKRAMAELGSEALTVGTAAAFVIVAIAIPSFELGKDELIRQQQLAVTFLDRYGNEIGKRGIRHDDSLKLEDLPNHLIKAVLATEDRRFYEHFGVDIIGTIRAVTVNARASGVVQGGSSVTQQLAKNLFLTNERSLDRKIREAFLALWLEQRLTKTEILKLYLDRAYMGGGTFGVQAAAEYYFGKSARDVTLAESAMLAGLFKAPSRYAPHINLPAARARANDVLSNMVEARYVTPGEIDTARRNPATPVDRTREARPDYFLDWAFEDIRKLATAGKLGQDRVLTVRTGFDRAIQARADQAVEQILRQHGRDYGASQAAAVVMDPDGAVRAIVGGRDYGASQFNRATDALRQPGSSFKTFVYAAAMSAGLYKPNSIVTDSSVCIGDWCPQNYGRSYSGSMPLTTALAKSINSIPVKMSIEIGRTVGREQHVGRAARFGRQKIIDTARAMGLTTPMALDNISMPIGSQEVTVIDMTAGYAVLANGGRKAQPHAGLEVRNSQGDVVYRQAEDKDERRQVLATSVAQDINFMLSRVPVEGTGRRAALDGVISAGKTGTTNGYKDAWYVGYTGNLVAGIWFGNDDSSETENMTGGSLPAMTWKEIMTTAHQGIELKPIPGVNDKPQPGIAGPVVAQASDARGQFQAAPVSSMPRRSFEVLTSMGEAFRAVGPTSGLRPSVQAGTPAQSRLR
jgi:penicillin-binding protein 1A